MPTEEQIHYLIKQTQYKARQIAWRYPAFGSLEDVQHDLIEDVLRRLPKFDGRRAGFKTFICRLINNKIATMITSHDALRRGNGRGRGDGLADSSLDDCRAVGVMTPVDSVELHNIPLVITVKLKKRQDTGDMGNEVRGYAKRDAAPASAQPAQATNTTPPWRR